MKVAVDHFGAHISYNFFFYFGLFIYFFKRYLLLIGFGNRQHLIRNGPLCGLCGPRPTVIVQTARDPHSGQWGSTFFLARMSARKKKDNKTNHTWLEIIMGYLYIFALSIFKKKFKSMPVQLFSTYTIYILFGYLQSAN